MNRRAIATVFAVGILGGAALFWQLARGEADRARPTDTTAARPAERASTPTRTASHTTPPPLFAELSVDDDPIGPLRLEGIVLDQDDHPVAGATVFLDSHSPRTTTSEPDGSFAFDRLVGRLYTLSALDDDAAGGPVVVRLTAISDPVSIRVREGARIEVAVVAKADGAPIEHATVGVFGHVRHAASTDRTGHAELRGVLEGNQVLYAEAPGFARHKRIITIASLDQRVRQRVELAPGATISGRVVDPNGNPIAAAEVIARDAGDLFTPTPRELEAVVTDGEGRFTLPALGAGSYRFVAHHAEHPPASTEPTEVYGARTDIIIVMEDGGVLAGRAVDTTGRPVAWANVHIGPDPNDGGLRGNNARRRLIIAGEDGRYRATGVERTRLVAMASSETASSELVAVDLREVAERTELELRLSIEGIIEGVVVDETDEPIAAAQVAAVPDFWSGESLDRTTLMGGPAFATTDGGGNFRLAGLAEGTYQLRASRSELGDNAFLTRGTRAVVGGPDVRLVLPADGGITGRLALPNGDAPELAVVSVGTKRAVPIDGGAIVVDGLVAGTHDVMIRGPQFSDRILEDVVITAGAVTDLGTIRLESGRAVYGRVVDHDSGAPVAGAQVVAARQLIGDGNTMAANLGPLLDETLGLRRATTDERGSYRLSGIGSGELILAADHPEHGRTHAIAMPAGSDDLEIDLELLAYGSLRGHVTQNGEPAAGATVMIVSSSTGRQRVQVETGTDGAYAVKRLPAGAYRVNAGVGVHGQATFAGRDIAIVGDQTASLDIDIATGEIALEVEIRGENDAQIDAAQVFVLDAGLRPATAKQLLELFARSRSSGAKVAFAMPPKPAEFSKMTAGAYSVCVLPINGDMSDPTFGQRIQRHVEALAVYCEDAQLSGSPLQQRHIAVVPPMSPLPE